MASTQHDLEFPTERARARSRSGRVAPRWTIRPTSTPASNWLFVGLGVVLAIGIVIGLWQIGSSPAGPGAAQLSKLAPYITPTR